MKIYVVANQKGGVGKTTTAIAMASILNEMGKKTLLIDCDPQCNSTDTYQAETKGVATLYDVILSGEERVPIDQAIQHTPCGDIIASDPLLVNADRMLLSDPSGLYRIKDALDELQTEYEYVVMDTATTMNSMLYNSLLAAHEVIIPITADRYCLQGLSQLHTTIVSVKNHQNAALNIAGLLLVRYNKRTNLSKETCLALSSIADKMNTRLFCTGIRESTKAREAQAKRMLLNYYAPRCTTAIDYREFVHELLDEE